MDDALKEKPFTRLWKGTCASSPLHATNTQEAGAEDLNWLPLCIHIVQELLILNIGGTSVHGNIKVGSGTSDNETATSIHVLWGSKMDEEELYGPKGGDVWAAVKRCGCMLKSSIEGRVHFCRWMELLQGHKIATWDSHASKVPGIGIHRLKGMIWKL
jgi:hypothetical protein